MWLPTCWHRPGRLPGGDDAEAGWCVCSHLQFFRATACSPPGSSVHGDSPGKNAGVDCHALLQGIFPIQGSNPSLLHCRRILYHLSHQESPRILDWVAYPSPKGSSQPKNRMGVSCITGYQGSLRLAALQPAIIWKARLAAQRLYQVRLSLAIELSKE